MLNLLPSNVAVPRPGRLEGRRLDRTRPPKADICAAVYRRSLPIIGRLAKRVQGAIRRDVTIVDANSTRSEKMPQPARTNAHVLLAKRPTGWVDESCFRIEDREEPFCGAEDVLVQAASFSRETRVSAKEITCGAS